MQVESVFVWFSLCFFMDLLKKGGYSTQRTLATLQQEVIPDHLFSAKQRTRHVDPLGAVVLFSQATWKA